MEAWPVWEFEQPRTWHAPDVLGCLLRRLGLGCGGTVVNNQCRASANTVVSDQRCVGRLLERAVRASEQPSKSQRDNDSSVGLVFDGIAHHVS